MARRAAFPQPGGVTIPAVPCQAGNALQGSAGDVHEGSVMAVRHPAAEILKS